MMMTDSSLTVDQLKDQSTKFLQRTARNETEGDDKNKHSAKMSLRQRLTSWTVQIRS